MKIDLCAVRSLEVNPNILGPHYQFRKVIGKGSEGLIYSAFNSTILSEVAIKIAKNENASLISSFFQKISQLRNPNIIKYYKVKSTDNRCYIIMQKCDDDLLTSINNTYERCLPESYSKRLFSQILRGLDACHQNKIFHGDLKPENILLLNGTIKLTDFNVEIARYQWTNNHNVIRHRDGDLSNVRVDLKDMFGSIPYQAPELQNSSCSCCHFEFDDKDFAAIDIWALGVTLFIMVSGTMPWESATESDPDYRRYLHDRSSFWPVCFSKDLQSLLMDMLHPCPAKRCTLSDMYNHSWLLQVESVTSVSSINSTSISSPQASIKSEDTGFNTPDYVERRKRACSFDISPKATTATTRDTIHDSTRRHLSYDKKKRKK